MRRHLSFGLLSITLVGALAASTAACSSSSPTTSPTSPAAVITTPPAPTSSAPPPTTSTTDLSGTWSGHYSGAFTGTFTLNWQQSGTKLSGTINLSTDGTPSINGTVTGNILRFGTVGSTVITYSGTVSGNSMSGSYTVAGSSGGSWSATKNG